MSLLSRLQQEKDKDKEKLKPEKPIIEVRQAITSPPATDPWRELKSIIHKETIKNIPMDHMDQIVTEEIEPVVQKIIDQYVEKNGTLLPRNERQKIAQEVIDEILGFGPISPLLKDDSVSEIMVNGPNQVYVERHGIVELSSVTFHDDQHVQHIIEKIVAPIGRRIDESQPMVDARLPDGSRVNAVIPPLSLKGPVITIRKFSRDPYGVEDLITFGTLTREMAYLLEACVKARLNIVVSGGTGSGKTTTLNVLSSFIPEHERIITIEDAAELQLHQNHVVTLETRPSNIEGKGAVTIRDLVKNSLRMRPERIIVGEVRGGEALDMLQAMNTGHDGSLTTGHANTPRDMLSRLETMVLMSGMDLPIRAIREQISSAIDVIVQQSRLRDGSRKITHITEILGMEGDTIVTQDIFKFEQTGIDSNVHVLGGFKAAGIRPRFMDTLLACGQILPENIFVK
ncbi:MAG: putative conjugal transfer protein [Candidatus Dichloromethanomonas elyunquensis]|nr:MAG: putative conjugal transfer protein [Candidatus Dichloromethanomonas elyunquensis]